MDYSIKIKYNPSRVRNNPYCVKNFPYFYRSRGFITAFTRARHVTLSRYRRNYSTSSQLIPLESTLMLSWHLSLHLLNGLLHWGLTLKILHTFPLSSSCAILALSIADYEIPHYSTRPSFLGLKSPLQHHVLWCNLSRFFFPNAHWCFLTSFKVASNLRWLYSVKEKDMWTDNRNGRESKCQRFQDITLWRNAWKPE
jgi:hypothetical protein